MGGDAEGRKERIREGGDLSVRFSGRRYLSPGILVAPLTGGKIASVGSPYLSEPDHSLCSRAATAAMFASHGYPNA